jgi:3-oxoacyl-[acyl-carrier protein] reductase
MKIDGKVAVVTGASRGVGRAVAVMLAQGGCSVVVNYARDSEGAEKTAAEVRAQGARAVCVRGDVAIDTECRRLMGEAVAQLGRLDILVNNAGTTRFIPHDDLEAVKDEDWESILGVNLKGPFQCVRAARPHLEASGGGVIVNTTSVAGIAGTGSSIPYCCSKAALINLTISLARVLGPRIRVNSVAPGFIAGEWLQQGLGPGYEAAREARARASVLGKVCQPEDVAAAILSLITGSDLVTGQTIVCDGGFLIAGEGISRAGSR